MKPKVFDDNKSLFHLFFGFITPILGIYGKVLFLVFLLYQLTEKEDLSSKIGDFIEFLTGAGGWTILKMLL